MIVFGAIPSTLPYKPRPPEYAGFDSESDKGGGPGDILVWCFAALCGVGLIIWLTRYCLNN